MDDPAVAETAMSGAIWARCLVPPKPGDSSAAAELIMATATAKEAVAHRIMASELRQGPLRTHFALLVCSRSPSWDRRRPGVPSDEAPGG